MELLGRGRRPHGGGVAGACRLWRSRGGASAAATAATVAATTALVLVLLADPSRGAPFDAAAVPRPDAVGGLSAVHLTDGAAGAAAVGAGATAAAASSVGGLSPPAYSAVLLAYAVALVLLALGRATGVLPLAWQAGGARVASVGAAALIAGRLGLEGVDAAAVGALSARRFAQYFAAGGICAFLTHAACTPIDVVKTRQQTAPPGKYAGAGDALRAILADEGPATLLKGFGATAAGYFLHGAFKYSFYEVFKVILTQGTPYSALVPPLRIAAASGFLAECIACILLCPMEAVRIRSVADSAFPSGVASGLALLFKSEGLHGLFKGLPSILLKQVPYTVGQFMSFEVAVTFVRLSVAAFTRNAPPTPATAAFISTMAGLLAGVMAGVISQPGDTILSKINQGESEGSALAQIARVARALGLRGLFLGLGARLVQVSCMVGAQFFIYDGIKLWCGITPASAVPVAVAAAAAAAGKAGGTVLGVAAPSAGVTRAAGAAVETAT